MCPSGRGTLLRFCLDLQMLFNPFWGLEFRTVYQKERTFLNRLKVQINEHLDLFPDLSYEELVKQFGTPKEVIMEYYANADDDYLLKKLMYQKN